jgi:hypothetical protein
MFENHMGALSCVSISCSPRSKNLDSFILTEMRGHFAHAYGRGSEPACLIINGGLHLPLLWKE